MCHKNFRITDNRQNEFSSGEKERERKKRERERERRRGREKVTTKHMGKNLACRCPPTKVFLICILGIKTVDKRQKDTK
jgi:hypothetical protein